MSDNVIPFPQNARFIDLDAIRRRAMTPRNDLEDADLDWLVSDRAELLEFIDRMEVIDNLEDLQKLNGQKEYCRVPQIVVARLQSGAMLAREFLIKLGGYYAAQKQLSPDSPTIRQRHSEAMEAMELARKAHGLPPLPKR